MVPAADFRSYYGGPVLKPPVWKVPEVPGYLYLGGLAGGSAALAALADATGRPALRRGGRLVAAGAALGSTGALVRDLGRPTRFLNMLRVLKPTSPLSVGSWTLAPFSGLACAAAASELTGRLPGLGTAAGAAAGALGPAMATYTAVVLADTAVPAWHEAYRELPFVFASSAVASAGAAGMLFTPVAEAGPARRLVLVGVAGELVASHRLTSRLAAHPDAPDGSLARPYRTGRSSAALRAAQALTVAGAVGTLLAGRSRTASVLAGLALSAGSVAARYGIFAAGLASARDPEYTVGPQRQRRDRAAASAHHHQDQQPGS